MEGQLTIAYWNARGVVQSSRTLAEYLGFAFEDRRFTDPAVWHAEKAVLSAESPLTNLPYLKDGDKYIFESAAIQVYLIHKAKRLDLFGENPDEQVLQMQARGVFEDSFKAFVGKLFGPKEAFDLQAVVQSTRAGLEKLSFLLGGKPFLTGDSVRLVDFALFEYFDLVKALDEANFNSFPHVVTQHTSMSNLPEIKAYLESSRFQNKFFGGNANWTN